MKLNDWIDTWWYMYFLNSIYICHSDAEHLQKGMYMMYKIYRYIGMFRHPLAWRHHASGWMLLLGNCWQICCGGVNINTHQYDTSWWFQIFFIFTPIIIYPIILFGEMIPFWLIFLKWVEITNWHRSTFYAIYFGSTSQQWHALVTLCQARMNKWRSWMMVYPPWTNIAPENWWLEDYSPFRMPILRGYFRVSIFFTILGKK